MKELGPTFKGQVQKTSKMKRAVFFCSCSMKVTTGLERCWRACAMVLSGTLLSYHVEF
jgi:hypothetical protein